MILRLTNWTAGVGGADAVITLSFAAVAGSVSGMCRLVTTVAPQLS